MARPLESHMTTSQSRSRDPDHLPPPPTPYIPLAMLPDVETVQTPATYPSAFDEDSQIAVHALLCPNPPSDCQSLLYDCSLDPGRALVSTRTSERLAPVVDDALAEQAFTPPVASMSLCIPGVPSTANWQIAIHDGITVGDVLWAIHNALQQPVGTAAWVEHTRDARHGAQVLEAARQRCLEAGNAFGGTADLRHVDWLLGDTQFAGLVMPKPEAPLFEVRFAPRTQSS